MPLDERTSRTRLMTVLAAAFALAAGALGLLLVAARESAGRAEARVAEQRSQLDFALAYAEDAAERAARLERHVPFLNAAAFRGERSTGFVERVTLRALDVSPTPDPLVNPYEDCLIALRVEVVKPAAVADEADDERATPAPSARRQPTVGDELVVYLWGFRGRNLAFEAAISKGDTFSAVLVAAEEMGQELSRLQVADTTDAFELDVWYGCEVALENVLRATRPRIVDPRLPAGASRAAAIQAVRERVLEERERFGGGDWDAWLERTRPFRDALHELRRSRSGLDDPPVDMQIDLYSEDGSSIESGSDALISGPPRGPGLTAALVVADVSAQLARHGIDLIFVPLPQKSEVYPEWVLPAERHGVVPEDRIVSPAWRRYVAELCDAGVEVVDLLPFLLEARRAGDRPLYLFDHHWAPAAIEIAADLVAQRIERYGLDERTHYWLVPGVFHVKAETYKADRVVSSRTKVVFEPDPASPVLVLGDSNATVGSGIRPVGVRSAVGGGPGQFAALLSERLRLPVADGGRHLIFEYGTIAKAPPGLMQGRRVVVLVTAMIRPAKPGQMPAERIVLPEAMFR